MINNKNVVLFVNVCFIEVTFYWKEEFANTLSMSSMLYILWFWSVSILFFTIFLEHNIPLFAHKTKCFNVYKVLPNWNPVTYICVDQWADSSLALQWRPNERDASQITSVLIVCSTVCSSANQRKHQSSASQAFVRKIHRWPVDSPHKGPVMWQMFPVDDVIMVAVMVCVLFGTKYLIE